MDVSLRETEIWRSGTWIRLSLSFLFIPVFSFSDQNQHHLHKTYCPNRLFISTRVSLSVGRRTRVTSLFYTVTTINTINMKQG
jgi:hypothetical protein